MSVDEADQGDRRVKVTSGLFNETIEFLITLLPGDSNVGGFTNTGWDLVANTLGAAVAAIVAPALERRRPPVVSPRTPR